MKYLKKAAFVLVVLAVLAMCNAGYVLAMSPEDQEAYNEWYRARFGTLPNQPPAQADPNPPAYPDPGPGQIDPDDDQSAYDAWYRARFGNRDATIPGAGTRSSVPTRALQPAVPTAFERGVIDLLNQERVRLGLRPLEIDPYLVQLARIKGEDMVKNGYYGHESPTYGYSPTLLSSFGISYKRSRENITVAGSPISAHESWMSSPKHKDNMLKPYWTHVGVGVVPRQPGSSLAYRYYVVELFVER